MKYSKMYLRLRSGLGDKKIFIFLLSLFGINAIIIAVSSSFPLPYDERYHFTLIQYYSQHLSPLIIDQPAELSVAGDATRLGSYISHYLLSFPLRLFSLFTADLNTQVFLLRLINISFVISALVLFRQFVLRLMKSGVAANGAVALLAALPVTSLLAAHINYDNLMLLIFAGLLVMAQKIAGQAKAGKGVTAPLLLSFVAIALLGCLVKLTFLPLAAVMLTFTTTLIIRRKAWPVLNTLYTRHAKISLAAAAILCMIATGLFAERYGGNLIAYKTLQPDCAAVQSLNVCSQYGPWARNSNLEQAAIADATFEGRSIQGYIANIWMPLMIRGLGGVNDQGIVAEIPKPILLGMMATMLLFVVGAMGAAVVYRKNSFVMMTVVAMGLYAVALLQRNYSEFMSLHEIVAVQGRYIVPFIIPLAVIGYMGLRVYVQRSKAIVQNAIRRARQLRTIKPDEAYGLSENYWSSKAWRRSSAED